MVRYSFRYDVRRLFGIALLASGILALTRAQPALALRGALQRADTARKTHFELHRPTKRDSIVAVAWALIGARYELGGSSLQSGFDCSGLVRFVLSKVDLDLPRTARQQAKLGAPIQRELLRPGDLLTFGPGKTVDHIGIYIGDGKFVHASSVAGRVVVSSVDRKPSKLVRPLIGARRLTALVDSATGIHRGS
jgi:cell wall-associated NlpC family hydrolase